MIFEQAIGPGRRTSRRRAQPKAVAIGCLSGLVAVTALMTQHTQALAAPYPSITTLTSEIPHAPDFSEAAISPDGHSLAWVQSIPGPGAIGSRGTEILLASVGSPWGAIRVTAEPSGHQTDRGAVWESSIAWSPDGSEIAFLSDARTPGQAELYVMRLSDHSVRQLTEVRGDLQSPQWSHDGRDIAVLFIEDAGRASGPVSAVPPQTGVIGQIVHEQRILVVNAATEQTRLASPADLYVYEYDWSPDDSRFAATAAHGDGDNNWYIADLYIIDATSGTTRVLLKPSTQIGVPRWSPDGSQIAFVAGLMSDEGVANGDLHVIPATGGKERDVTPELRASIVWFSWLKQSTDLVLAEARDGGSAVERLDPQSRKAAILWQGGQTLQAIAGFARSVSLDSHDTESAVVLQSYNQPPSLQVGAIGAWKVFRGTVIGRKSALWGDAESVHWRSDRFDVQGWLVPPKTLTPGRKYPMVVWIHGGPAWLETPTWPTSRYGNLVVLLAAEGYYVFLPNPRGSAGWGEEFERANVKDFGGGDLEDILAGVGRIVATRPVDERRIGIAGWSYGGYMTMWALTQTTRFRAAVAGGGVADWLSYYGENGIDQWMTPYFGGSVYDDPAVYAKSSPINFIRHVRTPTLILVGEYDIECPTPQSFEYWHALNALHVKTQLVVYPGEGHEFSNPKDTLDVLSRELSWFNENMPPAHATPRL